MRSRRLTGWRVALTIGVIVASAGIAGRADAAARRWSLSPTPPVLNSAFLNRVSCPTTTFCVAIGGSGDYNGDYTLAESWDGASWRVMPSPTVGRSSQLDGLTCTSTTNCVAVGYSASNPPATGSASTLIESWDGTQWSIVASPDSAAAYNTLHAVSCPAANRCFAVGTAFASGSASAPLIEEWDGSTWTIAPGPAPDGSAALDGLSCASTTACMAVGSLQSGSDLEGLAERWNGTSWAFVATDDAAPSVILSDVSCATARSCVAVGISGVYFGTNAAVIESWNGSAWSHADPPEPGALANSLGGVTCSSASRCIAVGDRDDGNQHGQTRPQTLIESWNGATWSVIGSPNPGHTRDVYLSSVWCATRRNCVAVGGAETKSSDQPFSMSSGATASS